MALVQEEPRTPIFRVMSSPEGANNALDGTINFIDETGLENPHLANSVAASTTPPTSQVPRETINFIEEPAPAGANGDAAAGDSTAKSSNTSISYNILEVASSAARPDKAAAPSTSTLHPPSVTVAEKKEQMTKKTGDTTTTTTISATKGTPLSRHTASKPASNPPSTNTTNLKTTLGSARTSNAKTAIPQPPKVSHRAKVAESKPHPSPPPSAAPRTRTTASRNHRIVLPPLPQQQEVQQAEVAPANKEPQPAQAAVLPAPQPVEEKKTSTTQDTATTTPPAAPAPIVTAVTQVKETTTATQNAEKDDAASEYSEAGEKEDEVAIGATAEKKATQLPGKIAAAAALAAVQHANEQDLLPSDHTCVLPGTQWEVILQHSRMTVDRTIVAEAAAATGLGPEYIRVTDLTATAKGLEAKLRIAHDPAVLSNAKVDELLSQCTFENTLLLHTLRTTKGPATTDTTGGGAAEAETMPPAPVIVAVTSDAASDAESEAAHEANTKAEGEEQKKEEEQEKSEPQPAEQQIQEETAAAARSATRPSLRPATIESPVYSFTRRIGNRRTGGHLSIRYAAGPFEPKQRLEFYFAAAPSHITGHFVRSCLATQLRVKPQRLQLRCNAFDVHDDTTGAELHWHSGTILDAILLQPRSNTAASHSHTALSESRPQTKPTDTAAPATEINNAAKKEEATGKDENVYRASLKQHRSAEEQRRWLEHLTTPTVSTQAKRVEKVNIEHEENTKSARPRRARSTSPRMRSHAPHRDNTTTTTTKGNTREEGGYTRQGRLVATARQPRRSKSNPSVPSLALPHYTAQQQQQHNEEVMGAHPGYLTPTESSRRKRTILIEWERELPSELTVQRTYSVRTPRTAKEPAPLLLPPPQPNEPRRSSAQTSRSHSRRLRSRTDSTPYPSTANHTTSTNMVNVYYNNNTNTNSATVTRSHSRREGSRRSNGLNGSHTSRLSSHMNTTTTFVHQVEPPQRVLRNVPATSLTLLLLRRAVRPVMNAQQQQQDPLSTQQGINHHHHHSTTALQNKAAYGIGAAPLRLTPTERVGETRSVSRRSHSPHRQFPAATHNTTSNHNNNNTHQEEHEQYEQELNGNAAETFHTMNKAMPQTSYLHAVGEPCVEADEPAPERHAPNPTR